jgi:DnaJ-class molecular chaperone
MVVRTPKPDLFSLVPSLATCPSCKGHGGWGGLSEPFEPCKRCEGRGTIAVVAAVEHLDREEDELVQD